MKKSKLIAIIIIILALVTFYLTKKPDENVKPVALMNSIQKESLGFSGHQCFTYHQIATTDAPYAVDEYLDINIDGKNVVGTKQGNQAGPDMTNGYMGDIVGQINGNILTSVYSYTVEGASNKEKEEYFIKDKDLIKQRYVLVEKDGILMPDKTNTPKDMYYTATPCK